MMTYLDFLWVPTVFFNSSKEFSHSFSKSNHLKVKIKLSNCSYTPLVLPSGFPKFNEFK